MRRRHTLGMQVIGSGSESDSQNGGFCSQKAGWGMIVGETPNDRGG